MSQIDAQLSIQYFALTNRGKKPGISEPNLANIHFMKTCFCFYSFMPF
jgi:hypothetical protein